LRRRRLVDWLGGSTGTEEGGWRCDTRHLNGSVSLVRGFGWFGHDGLSVLVCDDLVV